MEKYPSVFAPRKNIPFVYLYFQINYPKLDHRDSLCFLKTANQCGDCEWRQVLNPGVWLETVVPGILGEPSHWDSMGDSIIVIV
jgi:hypothetical protein